MLYFQGLVKLCRKQAAPHFAVMPGQVQRLHSLR
jgi:hypothetical protein